MINNFGHIRVLAVLLFLLGLALAAGVGCRPGPGFQSVQVVDQEPLPVAESEPVVEIVAEDPLPEPESDPITALVNATLIDGRGGSPLAGAVVLVRGDRIIAVGAESELEIPAGAEVIDLAGGYILPGFINAHVHLSYDPDTLRGWIQGGVTTVRDLGIRADPVGAPDHWQELIDLVDLSWQEPQYARIVMATPLITAPGGYGSAGVGTTGEGQRLVNDMLDGGARVVKVAVEDHMPHGRRYPLIDRAVLEAVVEAAHQRGAPVSAHVSTVAHVELALQAGVNDLAHMVYDRRLPLELVEQVVQAGVYWVPTLELWNGVSWGRQTGQNLDLFSAAGGKVALGTDFAGYAIDFDLGMPITEIRYMQAAGMSSMEIIIAATLNAAHVCGLGEELGTIEVGKLADIIVVSRDPLQDLEALLDLRLVMKAGEVVQAGP